MKDSRADDDSLVEADFLSPSADQGLTTPSKLTAEPELSDVSVTTSDSVSMSEADFASDIEMASPSPHPAHLAEMAQREKISALPALQVALASSWKIVDDMEAQGAVTKDSLSQLRGQAEACRSALQSAELTGEEVPKKLLAEARQIEQALATATHLAQSSSYSRVHRLKFSALTWESAAGALELITKERPSRLSFWGDGVKKFRDRAEDSRQEARTVGLADLEDMAKHAQGATSWKVKLLRPFAAISDRAALILAKAVSEAVFKAVEKQATREVLAVLMAARKEHPRDAFLQGLPVGRLARLTGADKAFVKKFMARAKLEALQHREPADFTGKLHLRLPSSGSERRFEAVTCSQTAASRMTDALARSYEKDGIHVSPCHDSAQASHARSLFHSEMLDSSGERMLSIIRHGVISAGAFTRGGVKKVPLEVLGAAAVRLMPELAGLTAEDLARSLAELAGKPGGEGARDAFFRSVGEKVRRLARTPEGEHQLEELRRRANAEAAKEVLAAAIASLPVSALERIAPQEGELVGEPLEEGEIVEPKPVVRLASVSALTPDAFRDGATDGERRMWRDQYAALAALRGPQIVQVPVVKNGVIQRDEHGRELTVKAEVEVDVASFNFAVNAFAVSELSKFDAVSGWETAKPANDEAMEMLLGKDFRAKAGSDDWRPGGWLGEALGDEEEWSPLDRRHFELAKQVAVMYTTDDYLGPGKDPYAMVERLLVLANYASDATALNCKSGKDRTTMAETHARDLAFTLRHEELPVPAPHQAPSDRTAPQRMRDLQLGGGGAHVQSVVAGVGGTKLHLSDNFHACAADLGPEAREAFITHMTAGSWGVGS